MFNVKAKMWKYRKIYSKTLLCQILFAMIFQLCQSDKMTIVPKSFNNISAESLSNMADRISKQYSIEYITFLKTGEESFELQDLNRQLQIQRSGQSWAHGFRNATTADKFLACTACRAVVNAAQHMLRDLQGEWVGLDKELYAKRFFLDICQRFNILQQDVCKGYFRAYWPIFEYIAQNSRIDRRIFCNRLGIAFCSIEQPKHNWVLTINDAGIKHEEMFKPKQPSRAANVKILQITDIHYDPEYRAGALAECEEPLCCQRMPTVNTISSKLAGYWGDYHVCDAPLRMIENAFDHMRKTHHDIKYIYQTGDVVAHGSWRATRVDIMETFTHMDKLMSEKFPGIPVYPCIGNNDVYPSDLSSPPGVAEPVNTAWLYSRLYLLWSKYLPTDTMETFLKGGYYTVSPHAGFRLISLNTNVCRLNNIWLYFNGSFAIEQLQWLHDTLLKAEQAEEYVHILAHTPINSAECWKAWSYEYFRLTERFQHIIRGVFYGHTHTNDLSLHYDNNGNPISVAWHGGSLTSFVGRNPSYRIYEAKHEMMQIIDHETWTFNLTAANLHGPSENPVWFRLSNFTEDFTSDLTPAGIDTLLERMATDPEILRKYWRSKFTASDAILARGCDENCLNKTLCGNLNHQMRCNSLEAKLGKSLLSEKSIKNAAASHSVQICVSMLSLVLLYRLM